MKKTMYVNGVVVGEVEATGDPDVDMGLMRDFLKAKGLDREVTIAQAMFMQATSFCRTAATLYERDLMKPPRNGLSVAPFIVNAALTIELYLKTLHQLQGAVFRGHSLLKLYDGLSAEMRSTLLDLAQRHGPSYQVSVSSADVFRGFVAELDNAFTAWRYWYETGEAGQVNTQSMILTMKVLDEACRQRGAT